MYIWAYVGPLHSIPVSFLHEDQWDIEAGNPRVRHTFVWKDVFYHQKWENPIPLLPIIPCLSVWCTFSLSRFQQSHLNKGAGRSEVTYNGTIRVEEKPDAVTGHVSITRRVPNMPRGPDHHHLQLDSFSLPYPVICNTDSLLLVNALFLRETTADKMGAETHNVKLCHNFQPSKNC